MSGPGTMEASEERPFPLGSRLAGAAFSLAGVAVAATLLLRAREAMIPRVLAQALATVDLLMGILLLAGVRIARVPAMVVVVAGAALLAGFATASGAIEFAIAAVAAQTGLAMLLAGAPRAGRMVGGIVLFAMAWLAMVGGVGLIRSKRSPSDTTTEEIPGGVVWGREVPYRLAVPPKAGYRRMKDAVARRQNAEIDVWLVKQSKDANVLVVVGHIEEGKSSPNALADEIVAHARSRYQAYEEVSRGPRPGGVTRALQLHTRGTVDGQRREWRIGVFIEGEIAYQVHASAPAREFAAVEPELESILQSFVPSRAQR